MGDPVSLVLSRLRERGHEPRESGDRWSCKCPAHEGKGTASLSVTRGDNGGALLHCFAGCATDGIVAALGLQTRDLFAASDDSSQVRQNHTGRRADKTVTYHSSWREALRPAIRRFGEPITFHEYRQADGTLVGGIVRFEPVGAEKEIRPCSTPDNGRTWCDKGFPAPRPLLYLADVIAAETVYVCEGEKAADALRSIGVTATTAAHGAKSPNKTDWSPMARKNVVIVPDHDEAGEIYASDVVKLAREAGAFSVVIVRLADIWQGIKKEDDAYDWIEAHDATDPADLVSMLQQLTDSAIMRPTEPAAATATATGTTKTPKARRAAGVPDILSTGAATLTDISTLTDTGLARRLVLESKGSLRYVREWKSWLAWDGRRWIHDEAGLAPQHIAKQVGDSLWRDIANLPQKSREDAFPFVKAASSSRAIDAAVKLARSEPEVIVSALQLDQHDYLLNVMNGTLDLRSAAMLPHSQDNLITHLAEVEFDDKAECPKWMKFIDEVTNGDEELAAFLQRSCGLALSGDVTEQSLWLHYGVGRNGKSTLLILISEILGTYAGPAPFDMLLVKGDKSREAETQFATLAGLRLATAIEADGGSRFSEATVKILTGGDPVQARKRFGHPWKLRPTWKLHVAVNDKPVVRGTDEGIWRRLKLTPWLRRFEGDNDNRNLKDELRAERSGILNWCLQGFLAWQSQGGLRPPESVLAATSEYRGENDTIGLWMAECCIQDATASCVAMTLFNSYRTWCEARGEKPNTHTAFGLAMQRLGFEKERPAFGPHRFKTIRRGIGLIASQFDDGVAA